MKLISTGNKANIKWFVVFSDGSKMRRSNGFIGNAFDAECSCGWATHSGGAIKARIEEEIWEHKYLDHDYKWVSKYDVAEAK